MKQDILNEGDISDLRLNYNRKSGDLNLCYDLKLRGIVIQADISLRGTDFELYSADLWIKYDGDLSRYHEYVLLRKLNGVWSLIESYLVPGYSYYDRTVPGRSYSNVTELVGITNIKEWLDDFIAANEGYLAGGGGFPPEGLHINCGGELKE